MSTIYDKYLTAFIRDVHQLLAWGYEGAKSLISSNDEETVITGYIVNAIEQKLDDPNIPDYYDRYEPHENKPNNRTKLTGKRRPLPDITIRMSGYKPRPEFVIEAKRLKKNGFPIGEYIGKNGLLCFIRNDYTSDCLAAAMIAYIQSDTPERWFTQLQDRFSSKKSASLQIKTALASISFFPELPHEWISEHTRIDDITIKIYHIFLDCCN